jgi:hypothetical protein
MTQVTAVFGAHVDVIVVGGLQQ